MFCADEVLVAMQPGIEWVRNEVSNRWPVDCCGDTCGAVLDDWWSDGHSKGLRGLGRGYLWNEITGWFVIDWEEERTAAHTWLVDKRSGTIVDPTAGQFLGGDPVRMFAPEHPDAVRYITEKQRKRWMRYGERPDQLEPVTT
jgi:hypothetical protein